MSHATQNEQIDSPEESGDGFVLSAVPGSAVIESTYAEPDADSGKESAHAQDTKPESDPVLSAVETSVSQWIGFDPAIHAVNPDGTPRLRTNGAYALKRGRGGRQRSDKSDTGDGDLFGSVPRETADVPRETVGDGSTPNTTPAVPGAAPVPVNSRDAAMMIVMTCTTVLSKVVGPEWVAEKQEVKTLTDATKVYLDSKGGLNVSPEMALFIAVVGYSVPRMAHENTRSKFGRLVDWSRDRFAVLRLRMGF